jgi:hypothetical protein
LTAICGAINDLTPLFDVVIFSASDFLRFYQSLIPSNFGSVAKIFATEPGITMLVI